MQHFCRIEFIEHSKSIQHVKKYIKVFQNIDCHIIVFVDTDDETKSKLHKLNNDKFRVIKDVPVVWFKKTTEDVFFEKCVTSSSDKKKLAQKFATNKDFKIYKNVYYIKDINKVSRGSNIKHILDQLLIIN